MIRPGPPRRTRRVVLTDRESARSRSGGQPPSASVARVHLQEMVYLATIKRVPANFLVTSGVQCLAEAYRGIRAHFAHPVTVEWMAASVHTRATTSTSVSKR